jgi:hypothetical protein
MWSSGKYATFHTGMYKVEHTKANTEGKGGREP